MSLCDSKRKAENQDADQRYERVVIWVKESVEGNERDWHAVRLIYSGTWQCVSSTSV